MVARLCVLSLAAAALSACGGDSSPSAPSPSPSALPFTGTFTAVSRITRCTPTPGLPLPTNPCVGTFAVGAAWPTRFDLTQSGSSVSGTVQFFDQDPVTLNLSGTVDANNRLTAAAANTFASVVRLNITTLHLLTAGPISGDWTMVATTTIGISGENNATLEATIAPR